MKRDEELMTLDELCFIVKCSHHLKIKSSIMLKILGRSSKAFNEAITPYEKYLSLQEVYNKFGLEYSGAKDVRLRAKSFTKTLIVKELQHFL
jgi:hypothetical protein